jgi:hypothetical protein
MMNDGVRVTNDKPLNGVAVDDFVSTILAQRIAIAEADSVAAQGVGL